MKMMVNTVFGNICLVHERSKKQTVGIIRLMLNTPTPAPSFSKQIVNSKAS